MTDIASKRAKYFYPHHYDELQQTVVRLQSSSLRSKFRRARHPSAQAFNHLSLVPKNAARSLRAKHLYTKKASSQHQATSVFPHDMHETQTCRSRRSLPDTGTLSTPPLAGSSAAAVSPSCNTAGPTTKAAEAASPPSPSSTPSLLRQRLKLFRNTLLRRLKI